MSRPFADPGHSRGRDFLACIRDLGHKTLRDFAVASGVDMKIVRRIAHAKRPNCGSPTLVKLVLAGVPLHLAAPDLDEALEWARVQKARATKPTPPREVASA